MSRPPQKARTARSVLLAFAAGLHRASATACIALVVLLLGAELAVVLLRYCLGIGFLQLQDFAAYLFAALVALGLPVALVADRHVRVDVWRERQGQGLRRRIDAVGTVLLLLPAFGATLWLVMPEVSFAWSIGEGSRETGGLGGVWLVKSVLPLACALMLVQGVALLLGGPAIDAGSPAESGPDVPADSPAATSAGPPAGPSAGPSAVTKPAPERSA